MILPGHAHVVRLGQGRTVDLGVAQMRVLASGDATNGGAFALTEFSGTSEGSWTVPHLHRLRGVVLHPGRPVHVHRRRGVHRGEPRNVHPGPAEHATRSARLQAEAGS